MDASGLKLNFNEILRKYANNKSVYIIIIIGIVFMLFSGTEETQKDNITQRYDAYTDEARLSEILSKIDGAGKVYVMVTYYGTTTNEVAFEKRQNITKSAEETIKSEETSAISSGSTPLIKGMMYPEAKGVVVIAEGAGDITVKKAIKDAVVAALEVASYKVCVLEGKD